MHHTSAFLHHSKKFPPLGGRVITACVHGPEEEEAIGHTKNNTLKAIPSEGKSLCCDRDSGESMPGQNGRLLVLPDSSLNLGRGVYDHDGREHGGRDHGGRDHGDGLSSSQPSV